MTLPVRDGRFDHTRRASGDRCAAVSGRIAIDIDGEVRIQGYPAPLVSGGGYGLTKRRAARFENDTRWTG
jgi:hypothetical protein